MRLWLGRAVRAARVIGGSDSDRFNSLRNIADGNDPGYDVLMMLEGDTVSVRFEVVGQV